MNFYNPYFMPYQAVAPKTGFLSSLLGKINLSSIISGTGKTLNTVNQVIPLIKQARPMMDNAKTMFKLMSEFNRSDTNKKSTPEQKKVVPTETTNLNNQIQENGPTFFL